MSSKKTEKSSKSKSKPEPASKAAHDKLRAEFNEFKDKVERALGLDHDA